MIFVRLILVKKVGQLCLIYINIILYILLLFLSLKELAPIYVKYQEDLAKQNY